ncbi:MAG: glutamyl-tRNA synthetase [Actinomycetota bacterium]
MSAPRYRFAPSPTGYFHVGGARTALYNWLLAVKNGGTFVLRIEDTDESRNQPQWTQGIIDALEWLGIHKDDSRFEGPYFQSANAAEHVAAAMRLFEQGKAYFCDQTTEQIQARAKEKGITGYDGHSRDRGLGPGDGRVLRFRVPEGKTVVHDLVRGEVEFDNATIEDFVLLRGNGTPVFLIANVVDDVLMRITNVIRAEEHLPNAPKQQMLFEALGEQVPSWAHVPVLVNEQRKKLSKRRDKVAVEQYREEGILAAAMVNYLMTLGWAPTGDTEIVPWETIVDQFRLEDVNHSPAFFDVKKLLAFNGEYIRMMALDDFIAAAEEVFSRSASWPRERYEPALFRAMAPLVQTRVALIPETIPMVDFLFLPEPPIDEDAFTKAFASEWAVPALRDIAAEFEACDFSAESLKAATERVGERHQVKLGKLQAPLRVAITGRQVGPPLFEPIELLGRQEVLRRIQSAITRAS